MGPAPLPIAMDMYHSYSKGLQILRWIHVAEVALNTRKS